MMSIRNLFFDFPQASFLMLFLLPLLFLQGCLFYYRQKQTIAFASDKILKSLLIPRSKFVHLCKMMICLLCWLFACLALMNPQGNLHYLSFAGGIPSPKTIDLAKQIHSHEIILLVDTSASMDVKDNPNGETRLERAKDIMDNLISLLTGQTVSLYAFTSTLTPMVPSTNDYLFTRMMIKGLSINEGDVEGTNFETALTLLKKKLFELPKEKLLTLILFSDGGDEQFEKLEDPYKQKAIQNILSILPDSIKDHLYFLTVGMGSSQPQLIPHVLFEGKPVYSKLEPFLLEQLATHYQGKYYLAESWTNKNLTEELNKQLLNESVRKQTEPAQSLERKVRLAKQDELLSDLYYQIPLGISIFLLLLYLILPDARRP
ncbi:vWA domain-containing protein [Candidatus Protochlamydia sp. R18]|uniref:vWA domain-containing protein n=1 Tax=Candidatus Protochlamydia sp. R18 TaxID=1353977 RepID=UPI0009ACB411|nr:VWA domain-containing protein [Candidatus Protochlamydia sp. R18]